MADDPDRNEQKTPSLIDHNQPGNAANQRVISVLYIDDEPALTDPVRAYLERRGNFSVDTLTSARVALEKIRTTAYDVIVSDYQMPGMDGIALLKELRRSGNRTPFIIFTGKGHEDVIIEAYNEGADFYIPKGGNPKAMFIDLTQKITQIVTRRRSEIALLASEERYRKVVEQSHDAIFIYQQGRLVFVNDRVPEITGYSKEELLAMDLWALFYEEDRINFQRMEQEAGSRIPIPETFETRMITKSGDTRYLEVAVTSLTTDGPGSVLGSVRDITDRKHAEELLRRSEEKYRAIFDTFDDLFYQTDMDGIITILSPSCKRITGWEVSELIGKQVLDLYPYPEQRKALLDYMFANGSAVHDYEVTLRNKDGDHLNVSVTSHIVRDSEGKPVAIEGVLRNITQRIRMEQALAKSESRFRTLADFLPVMVFETTLDGRLTFGNRLIMPVFGIDPDSDLTHINVFDYVAPEDQEKTKTNIQKMYAGISRDSNEYTLLRKDGSRFPAMINASPIIDEKTGRPTGMRGVIIDLTERKEAERALRESEQYLKTIFNFVQTALVIIDPETHTVHDLNPAALRLIGTERDRIIGAPCQENICVAKGGRCPVTDLRHRFENTEQILVTADGRKVPVMKTIVPVVISGRTYLLENISDITDRKRAQDAMQKAYFELEQKVDERTAELSRMTTNLKNEIDERSRVMEALRISEEKYRSLVEQTNDLVFQIDRDGRLTYISPNVFAILGYSADEVTGKCPDLFMPESERPLFRRLYDHIMQENHPVSGAELTFSTKAGKNRILEINGTPHISAGGTVIAFSGIARDITYRKTLQDEIASSLKEKEILLKEIHHRVKNNMQVISSLLSLQGKLMKDAKGREAIIESQNRVMSIALVHEKLYQSKSLARIEYNEYLKKMTKNLFDSYNVHPGRVTLSLESEEIILPITKAIPVSLIINELISNSLKYAFPNDRKGLVGIRFYKDGGNYHLSVWDDGVGFPQDVRWDRTDTLGLQLVSSLVGQLAGSVEFIANKGTRFTITFPGELSEGEHNE